MGSWTQVNANRAAPRLGGLLGTGTLSWFSIGGLWTAWVFTSSAAATQASHLGWGMVIVLSILWLAAVTIDWLQRLAVVTDGIAEIVRAGFLGAAMLVAPMALADPLPLLPYWLTAVVTLIALIFAAPLLTDRPTRGELERFVADLRLAVALAGVVLFVVVLFAASFAPLGLGLSPQSFASILAAVAFGVLPTAFTRLRTANQRAYPA